MITQIKHVQGRVFEKLLQSSGIEAFNGPQGTILHALWQEDGLPAVTLSKKTGLAKTTLTSMLARMEDKGLVSRVVDAKDKRQMNVYLSEEAKALEDAYHAISRQMTDLYFQGFNETEKATLEALLQRVLENLQRME